MALLSLLVHGDIMESHLDGTKTMSLKRPRDKISSLPVLVEVVQLDGFSNGENRPESRARLPLHVNPYVKSTTHSSVVGINVTGRLPSIRKNPYVKSSSSSLGSSSNRTRIDPNGVPRMDSTSPERISTTDHPTVSTVSTIHPIPIHPTLPVIRPSSASCTPTTTTSDSSVGDPTRRTPLVPVVVDPPIGWKNRTHPPLVSHTTTNRVTTPLASNSSCTVVVVVPCSQKSILARPERPGEALLPPELVYDPTILEEPIKDEYRSKLTRNAKLNQPLLNGWTLFGHQKRAILKGLMKRRLILALDMGLGKTLIGCVWARAFQESYENLKIFVICPTTLVTEWKRTAEMATGLVVEPESKAKKKQQHTTATATTTSSTTNTDDDDILAMTVTTWQKIPSRVDPRVQHYVAVFDEAHMMQSMESNRTQAALEFVTRDARCVGTLLLTGTPMKNGKPSNLFPLLKAVKHPLGANQRAFERHFCQGHLRSFGGVSTWVATGQANLKQLHRMIEPKLLHMTKDEYLNELPPMSQETRSVPVSPSFQKQYMEKIKILANLKEAMKTNKTLSSDSLLGAMTDVRIVCALAKVSATVEIAKTVLETEPSIVIFATYQKCVQQMAKHLTDCGHPVAAITGQTNPKERQVLVDGFQKELYSIFITTFGVGGVGITLTKARTVLFLDRPWTPGDILQAQDRIRRIGQEYPTRCIFVSAFEFDVQLDKLLNEKKLASNAVLTKEGLATLASTTGGAATKINIDHLAACLISRAKLFD